MFRADEGDGASLRRLCSQAECLRTHLRERLDNGDLSSAIKIAERSVANNCVVALLAMVQCVDRDASNEFRPIVCSSPDDANASTLNEMADVALLALTDLYMIGEAYLQSHGWFPIDQSSSVSGGIMYEHHESGETSEEPIVDDNMSWQLKLMLSIPILIEPGCVNGQVVWAAEVVYIINMVQQERMVGSYYLIWNVPKMKMKMVTTILMYLLLMY